MIIACLLAVLVESQNENRMLQVKVLEDILNQPRTEGQRLDRGHEVHFVHVVRRLMAHVRPGEDAAWRCSFVE